MSRAELKAQAKETLKGRWGNIIAITLIYLLISGAISLVGGLIPVIGSIAVLVISVPLAYGFSNQILKFSRKEEVGYFDFFKFGFDNIGKAWSIIGRTLLKLLPYIIAVVVLIIGMSIFLVRGLFTGTDSLGIALILYLIFIVVYVLTFAKSLYYVFAEYIGIDNESMNGSEAVNKSEEIMKGHRGEYFVLILSFIGWFLLGAITFGIAYIWVIPYLQMTEIKFYESLAGRNGNTQSVVDNGPVENN